MKKYHAYLAGLVMFSAVIFLLYSIKKSDDVNSKTFNKIIPKVKKGKKYYPYEIVKKGTKYSGLTFLDKGYDSLCIRLWYIYRSTTQVIQIKKREGFWTAESHNTELDLIDDTLIIPINRKSNQVYPKSEWNIFISKLVSHNIFTLPDDNELINYGGDADGILVIVEIATKKMYKIYCYANPLYHPEFPEARNMEAIMEIIDEELGVTRHEKF